MIIRRIVRLEFDPERVAEFVHFFSENKAVIASFPGCLSLELFQDDTFEHVYYTFSTWENAEALESYRQSETYTKLWSFAKARFAGKPLAYSLKAVG